MALVMLPVQTGNELMAVWSVTLILLCVLGGFVLEAMSDKAKRFVISSGVALGLAFMIAFYGDWGDVIPWCWCWW